MEPPPSPPPSAANTRGANISAASPRKKVVMAPMTDADLPPKPRRLQGNDGDVNKVLDHTAFKGPHWRCTSAAQVGSGQFRGKFCIFMIFDHLFIKFSSLYKF